MSKNNKQKKTDRKTAPDRYDWMKDCQGIPSLQSLPKDAIVDIILKPREKVSIPLSEYRALIEAAFALKIIKRGVESCKYSHEIESIVKTVLGDAEKKDGGDNG